VKHLGIAPVVVLMLMTTAAFAQSDAQKFAEKLKTQDNPLSGSNKFAYGYLKNVLLSTAQKMPEENYNFRPAWVVRSFGQMIRHVADSEYYFCSTVMGEKAPEPRIQETKTSKADLIAALKDAFAYCDKAYDGMTDASAAQMVKFHGLDLPKLFVLSANNMHTAEHYGNLVIYMRIKNVLPPTSEPGFMQ
jgi:uncharacterized damage-inducible protein DinB